jgi:hypothetical protein
VGSEAADAGSCQEKEIRIAQKAFVCWKQNRQRLIFDLTDASKYAILFCVDAGVAQSVEQLFLSQCWSKQQR